MMRLFKSVITLAIIFSMALAGGMLAGCEGPAGPQGQQGEAGQDGDDGDQGPPGEAGPGARVITFTLSESLEQSGMDQGGTISSPVADTGAYVWAAVFDTTFQEAVADSEFVLAYANLPGNDYLQLPLTMEYLLQNVTDFSSDAGSYSYELREFPFFTFNFPETVASFGSDSKVVYGQYFGNGLGYIRFAFSNDLGTIDVRTVGSSGLALDSNAVYGQELFEDGTRFPLDSDLSTPVREDYIMTDASGEFIYEMSSSQLGAMKDSLGQQLVLNDGDAWGVFPQGDHADFTGSVLSKNPVERSVEMVAEWGPDSVRVTAYMEGINHGDDETAYINNFPIEVKVVIIAGELAAKAKGQEGRLSYAEIQELLE